MIPGIAGLNGKLFLQASTNHGQVKDGGPGRWELSLQTVPFFFPLNHDGWKLSIIHSGNLKHSWLDNGLKMYFPIQNGIFQPAMLVYWRVVGIVAIGWYIVSHVFLVAENKANCC